MPIPSDSTDWLLIIFGCILLLFGSFALRSALTVAGGILGAALGLGAGHGIATFLEAGQNLTIGLYITGILLGLVAGVLLFKFMELVAFFLLGSGLTVWGMIGMAPLLDRMGVDDPRMVLAIAIPVVATIAGLLGVFYKRLILGVATAATGTFLIMTALDWPWNGLPAIPLFVLGFVFQAGRLRRRHRGRKVRKQGE